MRWLAQTVMLAWLAVGLIYVPFAQAAEPSSIADQSSHLTDYLHSHRLPLVGAQVMANPDGSRQVMLYGFTATEFGKNDAAAKTRAFLKDPDIAITNRIMIRPELANMKSPAPQAAATNPDVNAYTQQQTHDEQQYLQQQQSQYMSQPGSGSTSFLSTVVPLLGLGAAIMGMGGGMGVGSSGFGGGVGVSPGYGTGYGTYSGYGSYPAYPGTPPGYNSYPGYPPYPTAPSNPTLP